MELSIRTTEQAPLALNECLTPTALVLPAGLTVETWQEVGRQLRALDRSLMWWIGDWVRYGEATFGEQYREAMAATGYSYSHLRHAAELCEQFQSVRRRTECSFSHHQEVAALPAKQADRLLEKAAAAGWSTRDLRREVAHVRNGKSGKRAAEEEVKTKPTVSELAKEALLHDFFQGVAIELMIRHPSVHRPAMEKSVALLREKLARLLDGYRLIPIKEDAADV